MFKPTPFLQKMLRRLPLSPKQAGKEYYKGNRVGSMGAIDRFGNFAPDWSKIRTYVYPLRDPKNCELTPFVAENTPKQQRKEFGYENYAKRFTGADYLKAWKLAGGYDVVQTAEQTTRRNMPAPFEEKVVKA
ncbi:hypothetical protein CC86DRAFT_315532 [Ophiobolus disseminans]|uniref:50S ribosomal protein-like protein YmL27 n=1 Tax=Ophiobolus disseminans TaxID=1469910 RepID=A0A6A7AAL1_9PLEO|nr:hypothetical protein CC86DRAFT_315532 [Ophiobolus disseminans]